jgi:hypothetical protein
MNLFRSHFYTLLIFAILVAPVIAMVRYEDRKMVIRYGLKLFIFMVGGVIAASWVMRLI